MKTEIVDIDEIQEIIISYANGDFSRRIGTTDDHGNRNTLANGINMLGEELQATTISRDYFESIYDAVSDILIVTDSKLMITDLNNAAESKLGVSKKELIGRDTRSLIKTEPEDLDQIIQEFKEETRKKFSREMSLFSNSTEDLIVNCVVSTIVDRFNKENGYLIIATDITKKKKEEHTTLNLIISAQEAERKRLAHDLHDSFGQELNAIKMYLDTLDYMDKSASNYDQIYKDCKSMLETSINSIQSLSYDLMPKSLEMANLSYALKELCEKLSTVHNIQHNFDGKEMKLSKSTEIIIYRIFQEFINNTMKYAKGSFLKLNVIKRKGETQFILLDNGPGFDAHKIRKGNGIQNIKSRLHAIDALYVYQGLEGVGTKLEFKVRHENN